MILRERAKEIRWSYSKSQQRKTETRRFFYRRNLGWLGLTIMLYFNKEHGTKDIAINYQHHQQEEAEQGVRPGIATMRMRLGDH